MEMNDYDCALAVFKEVEEIQKETIGERHDSYLTTKHNIGHCLTKMNDYDGALAVFKEVEVLC